MTVQEYAYAKLNLTLDVLAKRADGYHDMMMVMQTVSVCDSIRISRTAESGIRTSCNFYYIPTDGRNLAARAAKVFLHWIGEPEQGIEIRSCSNYTGLGAGYFRIAVRRHEDNEVLVKAIKKLY